MVKSTYKKKDREFIKDILHANNKDILRKYTYILNNKEKLDFIKQLGFFLTVYDDYDMLLDCLINKFIKQKSFNIMFKNLGDDYKQYLEIKRLEYNYYELTGKSLCPINCI